MRYYVIKDGRTHSDFDNYKEAKALADSIGGEVAECKTRMIDCVVESLFLNPKFNDRKPTTPSTEDIKKVVDEVEGKHKEDAVRFLRSAGIMDTKENCLSENYRTDMNSTELIAAAKKAMEKELERCIERGTQPSFYTMFLEGYAQGFNEAKELFNKE